MSLLVSHGVNGNTSSLAHNPYVRSCISLTTATFLAISRVLVESVSFHVVAEVAAL